jgi:hypothetical protein
LQADSIDDALRVRALATLEIVLVEWELTRGDR